MAANPSWWLTDAKHTGPVNSTWKTFDLTVAAAMRVWQQTALNLTATGVVDSGFADGCVSRGSGPHLTPAGAGALLVAKQQMLRELQPQLPGPLICGSDGSFPPGVGGVQAGGWGVVPKGGRTHFSTVEIPALMKAVSARLVFQAHGRAVCNQSRQLPTCCVASGPPCDCATPRPDHDEPAVQTELAAFLVGMGERSYFTCGSWEDTLSSPTTSSWLPVYDLPLGEPIANASLGADGVWRRSFASGTRATFDTVAEVGRVFWACAES